jgi:hypothetical protein
MGFFGSIGKAIGGAFKGVASVVKKTLPTVLTAGTSFIPGLGPLAVAAKLGGIGKLATKGADLYAKLKGVAKQVKDAAGRVPAAVRAAGEAAADALAAPAGGPQGEYVVCYVPFKDLHAGTSGGW